jgi:hypothetical protein
MENENKKWSINYDRQKKTSVETLATKGEIQAVIGTPNKDLWFKCHPSFATELTIAKGKVGSGKTAITRMYLVDGKDDATHAKLVDNLDIVYQADCVLFCTTNHFWGIWPIKISPDGTEPHPAHSSARTCYQRACKSFLKMRYMDHKTGYAGREPSSPEKFLKKEPPWPKEDDWHKILNTAFKSNVITDTDHPVYLDAIGDVV